MANQMTPSKPTQTMSHVQIAELTGKRNDTVKLSMERLFGNGLIHLTPVTEVNHKGQKFLAYHVNERDSYVVVARLSPEFTARLVDEWIRLRGGDNKTPSTYLEAIEQLIEKQKALEEQAPKVMFYDSVVEAKNLMNATQVAQKLGKSAFWLNKQLEQFCVYNGNVKRSRAFCHWFVDKGYGKMKLTSLGYSQPLFTNKGEAWVFEKLTSEGVI